MKNSTYCLFLNHIENNWIMSLFGHLLSINYIYITSVKILSFNLLSRTAVGWKCLLNFLNSVWS